ncbi:GNAT family N-acetyltransferase [Peribacillus frigoritolerans]|uniref:GNAT family N-acetyltransferase n=1 Tax=Peribacillus frigoritolerans TaxID=450367 RepID=UPI00207A4150|nr:GNAT family N-acetyltransferase [Peribacillus frigoritolerans]MEE3953450.1 GNAT family N-acetyltransferase [Peribacillus frigoritolerans]USK63422.1 GNAT family N-acetyltransferase [Peribacillus frigoritolerans]
MNNEFEKAINLLENKDKETYPTFAYSVLNNYIPGQVYMDELKKTVLIGTDSGIFIVGGDEMDKGLDSIFLEIFNSRKNDNKRFTLFSPSKEWDQVINRLFENELRQMHRYSFHFNKDTYSTIKKGKSPNDFIVKRIDEKIITESLEFNESYYNEYWGSVSNFLENGFGYCLLHNDTVVSECTSIFSSSQFAEIDIATKNKYRGMGLAQNVAEIFIEHCIGRNLKPNWDCNVNNFASIKLAERLGFENPMEYSVFVRK